MGRDGAAAWTDPSGNSPSLGQTASRVDDMAWPDSNDLYIVDPDSLDHPADSKIDRSLQNPTQLPSPPPVEVPHWTVGTQNSPRAWGSNAFELIANAAMSRQSSQGGNINPPQYQLTSSESPADQAKSMSQNNKDQLIGSLRTHKVNTITELRRIEKIFAYLDSEEVTEPMTAAWAHYVNSNNLLNELRGLTRTIPFSSECLDEAKALVVADPASVRSWNYCWLVLIKIEKENLITKFARALGAKRSTWGDRQPTSDEVRKFITACVTEWTRAVRQMLKHWESPPSTTGN